MAWHQVTTQAANAYLSDVMAGVEGLNTISPTGFLSVIMKAILQVLLPQIMWRRRIRWVWRSGG